MFFDDSDCGRRLDVEAFQGFWGGQITVPLFDLNDKTAVAMGSATGSFLYRPGEAVRGS